MHIYKTIKHILILSLFINLSLAQSDWVKTESGCEYWTSNTDAEKITWDDECKDGKVHGDGKLVLYKDGEVFYEFNGVILDGYTKKGKIRWVMGNYANYVWIWDKDPTDPKVIGKLESNDGVTRIGEIGGFEEAHLVHIYADGTYKAGIGINNEWRELITVSEIENYFINNYDKFDYEHFIPIEIPKKTIAISYFDNTSGDKSYDPLIKGLADMLISDLSNIESIKMVEREKLDALLKEIDLGGSKFINSETAQKMGKGLGAQFILTGSFIVMGDAFRVDARLINVENGEIVFSKAVDGNKDTFFDIEKELANEIISKLELSVSKQTLSAMEESGTRSYDAYYYWTVGNGFFQEAQYDSAMVYYEKSLSHDPNFISALETIYGTYHSHINLLYPEYYLKSFDEDWISKINDIFIFINFYQLLTSKDLSQTSLSDYSKILTGTICDIISTYYCNSSKYVDDRNNCGDDDMANALIWAEKAYNLNPSKEHANSYGFYSLRNAADPKTASNLYMQAISLDSTYTPPYLGLMEIFIQYNNYEGLIKYGTKYIRLAPNNQAIYFHVALAYQGLGYYANAIEYYEEYNKLGYGTSASYWAIGICYYFLGEYKKAVEYLLLPHEDSDPSNQAQNYNYLAYSYYYLQSYLKASDYQKKYIETVLDNNLENFDLVVAYSNLAELSKKIEDYKTMESSLLSAKAINGSDWLVLNNLCEYFMITKEYDKALEEIKAAIRIAPELPNVHDTMGDLQVAMGNHDKALDFYFQAIEKDSTYSDSYLHIAMVYEQQKNDDHIEYYSKAAGLDNKDAKRWVKKNKKLIDEHNNKSKKSPSADYIEELKKLAELRDLGIITEEEFQQKKKELLGIK